MHRKQRLSFVFLIASVLILNNEPPANGLIIPDELPTLLSLIYSNIPTFKKGTDSRLGWGFRLGDRADFQVLVELGPQKETAPLGNQQDGSSNNKRHVIGNFADNLYAQQHHPDGASYLKQWRDKQQVSSSTTEAEPERFELGVGEVDAKEYIKDDAIAQLETLYEKRPAKKNAAKPPMVTSTIKPSTSTSYKDALDNVDLD